MYKILVNRTFKIVDPDDVHNGTPVELVEEDFYHIASAKQHAEDLMKDDRNISSVYIISIELTAKPAVAWIQHA